MENRKRNPKLRMIKMIQCHLPLSTTFPPGFFDKWKPGENIVPDSRCAASLLQPWSIIAKHLEKEKQ